MNQVAKSYGSLVLVTKAYNKMQEASWAIGAVQEGMS